ncbi:MAG: cobyrinate a,c-diamide synthase [Eubacteriales bacterium]|nr:cobyrinate a,c-diamide synthase [Eubacteriales bacterium]
MREEGTFPRFLLTAGASGSGKTLLTCGILRVLKKRGLKVTSFKCGPDYIDPMFHEKVLKTKSRNLDTFFTDEETTRWIFAENAKEADVSVIEGVMGYYDGLGGISEKASAWDVARVTRTPAVLVVNAKGMSLSVLAYIRGYMSYRRDSYIKGVILNQMSAGLYGDMKKRIEEELGVRVYGYVPKLKEGVIESRHLGLVTPGEIEGLTEKLEVLAKVLEESLDIDGLLLLARSAKPLDGGMRQAKMAVPEKLKSLLCSERTAAVRREAPVIAVARDEAFCFVYEDNLQLLRKLGASIVEFSPIHDARIPEEASGLLLYGGYPELYAAQLSENGSMLTDIREKIEGGLPCMAECGGFMYLHRTMEDMDKREWPMAGVIDARAFRTERLGRFGYIVLQEEKAGENLNPGDVQKAKDSQKPVDSQEIRGHEFHYFDSTDNGDCYIARKPLRKRSWKCIHKTDTLMAGFPHLYYYGAPSLAADFLEKCIYYKERKR